MKYKVICLDMFQTLVDINTRKEEVWKGILEDTFDNHEWKNYWNEANKVLFSLIREYDKDEENFLTVKEIFSLCYKQIFEKYNLDINPEKAARILAEEHNYAKIYADVPEFLKEIEKAYKICLVSDSDFDMVEKILPNFNFDQIFISEKYRSYKNNPKGKLFNQVINHYGVNPEEILHIGDSYPDIYGSNITGIKNCWLNRYNNIWKFPIIPDHTVTSFVEIKSIL